jgi:hypothetical protein
MIEKTILSHLVYNEPFARKVLPFLKDEYFNALSEKVVYGIIRDYIEKYNSTPTKEVLALELSSMDGMNETTFKDSKSLIEAAEKLVNE